MKVSFYWLSVLFLITFALQTQAATGYKAGVGFIYLSDETEGNSLGASELNITEYNAKAGYISGSVFYGVILDSLTKEGGTAKATRSSTGLVIGYHGKAWYLDGIYFVTSNYTTVSDAKLKEGSGMGADLGYNFLQDSGKYFLNAQISYKTFEYKKVDSVTETNKISSEIYPMLVFGVTFAR